MALEGKDLDDSEFPETVFELAGGSGSPDTGSELSERSDKDSNELERNGEKLTSPVEPDLPVVMPGAVESPANRTFESSDGREFIAVEPLNAFEICQLQFSARIIHDGMRIVVHNFGCLMLAGDSFVAKVRLLYRRGLMFATHFNQAKSALLRQLCVTEIYVDKVMAQRNCLRSELLASLKRIRERTVMDNICAVDALQIFNVVRERFSINYVEFCRQLSTNSLISKDLQGQAVTLLRIENTTEKRNKVLAMFKAKFENSSLELHSALKQFRETILKVRVKALLDMAPDYLKHHLKGIPERTIFLIHENDVKVFHDLDKVMNKDIFAKPLDNLAKRWTTQIKLKQSEHIESVLNPIYFSLCRSLEELIVEIAYRTDHKPEELLLSDDSGWHPRTSAITWTTVTDFTKCLQQEYHFVFRLLKHFDPVTGSKTPFEYQPQRLLADRLNIDLSLVCRASDVNYVWFCWIDDVLHYALPEETYQNLDTYAQILKDLVQLIAKATVQQMETIRVITQSTTRFIVQTFPFVNATHSDEDKQILQSQLALGSKSANTFRDMVEVFSGYWKNRCEVIEHIPAKNVLQEMEQIKKALLQVVVVALRKDAAAGHTVDFFRSLNDFFVDLDNVSFDWLIKSVPGLEMSCMIGLKLVEPVDNRLIETANQTYRVTKPNKFQKLVFLLLDGATNPKHYLIEVVTKLLGYIRLQLDRAAWLDSEQVASSSALISSIRSSLMYLSEQSDYVSFDLFAEESTKPFGNVIENSRDLSDFNRRVSLIKESFCYLRKQNEMSLAEALQMYRKLNVSSSDGVERIQQAYRHYSDQFLAYMGQPGQDKAAVIAKRVRGFVTKSNLFKNWTAQFKREELPKILAGVAAVWSIMVSEDVSSTGKFFKPHCIQVLCVLRLLGVDRDEPGVNKHLAQVLTGQGKSLILALIAIILALTGHEIQLVCYNEYLVKRDAKDFANLYELFGVKDAIQYGTFDNMANAIIAPEVDGEKKGLRSFVGDLIVSEPTSKRPTKPKAKVQDSSVLLMDEVDVFFTKEYYGSVYGPISLPYIALVDVIQKAIWCIVNDHGVHDFATVSSRIQGYIASLESTAKIGFNQFLSKREAYDLLVHQGDKYVRKSYTNEVLFAEHLNLMISNAIKVATETNDYQNYIIDQEGAIAYRVDEKFETNIKHQYFSVFHYFRLKKDNFVRYVGAGNNYGYLNIDCGSLSYAMLPKAFPLILGVTGTLTSLNQYERTTIERHYNITHSSIMPSFFGCSNNCFNSFQDFTHLATRPLWMSKIFSQAYAAVTAKRAVLIFFYKGTLLEEFRDQYCSQFDRLQVLTENTDESLQEHLINEAGIAKTVTLATRGMGRGVDYKSSVAVEKSGGVHVIQTFFSLDVKEETQIRGRTARKDNRGSYELIVYDDDLKTQRLLVTSGVGLPVVTYAALNAARSSISLDENRDIEASIQRNSGLHATTLEYLQSFFM